MSATAKAQCLTTRCIRDLPIHIGDGNYSAKYPKTGDFLPTGVPFISASDLQNGRIRPDSFRFISIEQHSRLKKGHIKSGDVLVVTRGNGVGGVSFVDSQFEGCNINAQLVLLRADENELHCRYVYYLLSSPTYQILLKKFGTGSAQPQIPIWSLKSFELQYPPYSEQKSVAAALGALDDKIELNRQMNDTLEGIARSLFKSWFVDFDPVRAKLDGRQPPGLDPATAALFPARFHHSDLGNIPEGWQISTISAKCSTVLGGTPSRANPEFWTNGSVAWINSGKTNEFRIIEPSEWITKEALENSSTKMLPRRTTILAITGATLGQVSITEIECCANQSVCAILGTEQFPTEFIYPWIEENIDKLIASQTGGAQQHINKGNVDELALLCPDPLVVISYLKAVRPVFDRIATNCFESRTLAALRDALLPKLLSGEIRIPAAEKLVEEVG